MKKMPKIPWQNRESMVIFTYQHGSCGTFEIRVKENIQKNFKLGIKYWEISSDTYNTSGVEP